MHTIYYKVLKTFSTIVEDLNETTNSSKFIEIPKDTLLKKTIDEIEYRFYVNNKLHTLNSDVVENNQEYFEYDSMNSGEQSVDNNLLESEYDSMKEQFLDLYENLCSINNIDYKENPHNRVLELINRWAGVEIEYEREPIVNYYTSTTSPFFISSDEYVYSI